ncbi:MAG: methyltransferase domain-containing protein [Pseudomonadota bacterium]
MNDRRTTRIYRWLQARWREITVHPRVGRVEFGDLCQLMPLSHEFGYDRGQPVDRYYIESFLSRHASDIYGHVLEIGDNNYTRQFGAERVTHSDVLHIREGNPQATLVGDLTSAEHIPSQRFDCIIFTQTLQFIYDCPAAVNTLHRILKPGGTLLATVPGISKIPQDQWGKLCCWAFTELSIQRLFGTAFPQSSVNVESRGNVLSAVAFLHGLATEELDPRELDYHDPLYQVVISIKASKPE